ncbi:MAG TPA: ATP-dependent RecD-like DNA helicase [Thermoanaerobaculia bacterium]|nr:ATP-dependent RecD-like DNA helicase [Thermoanaerobaculia bacterium]
MQERIAAKVDRTRFHNPDNGFSVVVAMRDDTGEEVTIVGTFPPLQEGEPIVAVGEYRDDRRWGPQFVAEELDVVLPTTAEGIESYLAAGHVKGIRKGLARKLVLAFGDDLLRILDEEPRRLLGMAGLGEKKLEKIIASWEEQRGVRQLMMFLAHHGLSGARAFRIHKHYGNRAIQLIKENPYRLAHDVRGIGFATADAIARRLGLDPTSPFRLLAGVRHIIDTARDRNGHCGLAREDVRGETAKLLQVDADLIDAAMDSAVQMRVVVEESGVLYDPALYDAESRIARKLLELAAEAPAWAEEIDVDAAIDAAENMHAIALHADQRRAIHAALGARAAVITGGPGVGKTTLVQTLLSVLHSTGVEVQLAAPTGRAAKRLGESTGATAQTIHRLLEMSPESGRFQRNEDEPIEGDVVILDEASMIDVPLLDAVLRALAPDASLILVGDADQLPSIGAGQVLHDILASERIPSVRLTKIHRQAEGSDIITNAHRINRGEAPRFRAPAENPDMFHFRVNAPDEAVTRVVELVTERIPRRFGMRSLRDVQVLAPMRKGLVGIDGLNRELQRALNPSEKHRRKVQRPNDVVFLPGDKVMQTENNYDKSVFNGDVGVIAAIEPEKEVFAVDYGADLIVDYTFDEADQLTLAYATTIHKSQGSEYPAVVVVLMPQHSIMLRRNLLYTAVTRGRKLVVLVGDQRSIDMAVRTGKGGERYTRLANLLGAAGP